MDTSLSIGLLALFAALTVFFILYAIYAPIVERPKSVIEQEIFGEQADVYEADDSLGKYVRPVLNNFLPQMPSIPLSDERKKSLNNLMLKSGNPWKVTVEEFIGLSIALSVFGLLIGAAVAASGTIPDILPPIVVVAFLAFAGLAMPYSVYNTRKESRSKVIQRQLPEALDLLTITIATGQSFEFALTSVSTQLPEGLLRTEFSNFKLVQH
jgi:Flp pilus assembly protein TadB